MDLHWLVLRKHIFTPQFSRVYFMVKLSKWLGLGGCSLTPGGRQDVPRQGRVTQKDSSELWRPPVQEREGKKGGREGSREGGGREGGRNEGVNMSRKGWQRSSKENVSVWRSRKSTMMSWRLCLLNLQWSGIFFSWLLNLRENGIFIISICKH